MLPEGWRKENINSVTEKVGSGITPKGGNAVYKKQGIQFLRSQNVQWGKLSLDDVAFIDDTQHNRMKSTAVKYGDVLLNITGASIGRSGAYNSHKEANVNQHVCIIRSNGKIDHNYLVNFLISPYGQKQIDQFQAGGNRQGLNFEQIKSLKISLPPLPEQKKIAAILSTWDRAIEGTEQLLANSQQQKKALMQQLLTGKKRLPGFTGEWKKTTIGNIAKEISIRNKNRKNYPVISCTKTKGFVDSLSFFNKKVYSDDLSGYKIISRNQIGFPSNHIEEGSIGLQNLHDDAIVSPIYTVFSMGKNADPLFVFAVLKTDHYRQIFAAATNSSVDRRGSLRWSAFSQIKINLPSPPEQKAIAAVLTTADEEITAIESDLSRLRQEKKALMQQLLTGKRRVKVD
ncbi:type I restriction-modification enzyme S subunit [Acetobacter pasteurianus NBRC 101655]|nr:type I restriction-modification enzyme S subunit [Acetobacter pasteurianus NBRC 101655]